MDRSPASGEVVAQVKQPIREYRLFEAEPESNSELCHAVDPGSEGSRVSCGPKRETTQTVVKVPKCWLSVMKVVTGRRQRGG